MTKHPQQPSLSGWVFTLGRWRLRAVLRPRLAPPCVASPFWLWLGCDCWFGIAHTSFREFWDSLCTDCTIQRPESFAAADSYILL